MTKRDDGGPAFPVGESTFLVPGCGMSLRDWFAGQIIQVAYTNPKYNMSHDEAATWAYIIADAMLKERCK